MRILLVSDHDYLPDRVGGRESSIDELANLLMKRGHDVAVLARAKTTNARRPAGKIHWPVLYEIERVANVFGAAERHLASSQYDFAIYSVKRFPENISAVEDVRRRQVLYVRDAVEVDNWTADTFPQAQVIIANSNFIADRVLERTGISAHVVPPVVDFSKYRVDKTGSKITFINPVDEKGASLAFAIAQHNPEMPFQFVLCWDLDSQDIKRSEKRAKALGNITIVEAQLDVRQIYASTHILLMPSRWVEGFGRVVLEAQCNGLPVIASARGGLPQAIGDGGVLLDGDADLEAWSDALAALWNDQRHWREISNKARARAQAFETETEENVVRLETVLQQISHRVTNLRHPICKCAAILLPSSDGTQTALQSLLGQNIDHLEIIALRLHAQDYDELDEADREKVGYRDLSKHQPLAPQIFAAIRETECAFVVLLRPGDRIDPDFIYALSNAHLNSLWTAAVAMCDVGVINRKGDVVVSSTCDFKTRAANDSRLAAFEDHKDTFGLSAILMPWHVIKLGRLPTGLMFRRDALLLLDDPTSSDDVDDLIGYLRFGAHLVGGTVYVDRVLCWSAEHGDALIATLPYPADGDTSHDLWDAVVARLVENGMTRYLKPAHISRMLFGHLPKHRVAELCERHPLLREALLKAFFDDSAPLAMPAAT